MGGRMGYDMIWHDVHVIWQDIKLGLSENGGNHGMSNKFYGNGNEKMMISPWIEQGTLSSDKPIWLFLIFDDPWS